VKEDVVFNEFAGIKCLVRDMKLENDERIPFKSPLG
jgi:hypothetical protein